MLHFARRHKSPSAAAAAAALPSSGHPPPASSVPTSPRLRRTQAPNPRPYPDSTVTPPHHGAPSGSPPPPRPARRPLTDHHHRLRSPPDLQRSTLSLIAEMSSHNANSRTLPKPLALSSSEMQNATGVTASSAAASEEENLPSPWLESLMRSSFFERCGAHPEWYGINRRCPAKNGCNFLCVDCCAAVCARCTQEDHHGHRAVQVRVSSFQTVVKVDDIRPFFDLAGVQTHLINGFRVVCINTRPKTPGTGRWPGRGAEGSSSACKVCSRVLRGVHDFCSIECKVSDHAAAAAAAQQRQNAEAAVTMTMSEATVTVMLSGARKRARKAIPQRAHLGCTL